ncbi:PQQ-binding-like beta-propeller repeat protein [Haloglomus litoreum]|uniref:outer membrane protein assembly factor BamB family protein n=1 Tax=Haloglomus litoreum TaxID=3034026 RepID=UPI0023E8DB71|nr:PQQ-binding-like beta-propeller repeat protein [Haloglomus sp. DT116]
MPSRRAFLAASSAAFAALAGCSTTDGPADSTTDPPTDIPTTAPDSPTPTPTDDDRPTQTPRDPRPLDISGTWPQRGYGAGHAGVAPATGVPDDGTAYWHLRRIRSGPPLLADGRLFHFGLTGDDGPGPPTRTASPPVGTGHQPEGALTLFCRDARDGKVRWTRRLPGRTRSGVVAGDRMVVAGEGFVRAYTLAGNLAWERDLGSRMASVGTTIDGTVMASTEIPRQGDRDADVRAYAVADGARRWRRPSPRWRAALAADGETVYALSSEFQVGSTLTARTLDDGRPHWSVELDDNGIPAGPFAAGDTVYVAPDDGGIHAFARSDARRRWHYEATTPNTVGLAADGDRAYLVDDGTLRVLEATTGDERYAVTPNHGGYARQPAVGSECIYLGRRGDGGELAALARDDGRERWTLRFPETVVEGDMVVSGLAAQPVVAEGGVYAFAWDGLYALGPGED